MIRYNLKEFANIVTENFLDNHDLIRELMNLSEEDYERFLDELDEVSRKNLVFDVITETDVLELNRISKKYNFEYEIYKESFWSRFKRKRK